MFPRSGCAHSPGAFGWSDHHKGAPRAAALDARKACQAQWCWTEPSGDVKQKGFSFFLSPVPRVLLAHCFHFFHLFALLSHFYFVLHKESRAVAWGELDVQAKHTLLVYDNLWRTSYCHKQFVKEQRHLRRGRSWLLFRAAV